MDNETTEFLADLTTEQCRHQLVATTRFVQHLIEQHGACVLETTDPDDVVCIDKTFISGIESLVLVYLERVNHEQ